MKNKTKRNFKRASMVLLVFSVFVFAFTFNIFDVFSQEYGEGNYCLHVNFDQFEDGFSMDNIHSVTVNDNEWTSIDDLYNASPINGNLWTIKIVAGMNGDYYPDISFAGGSLIENPDDPNDNGFVLYTAVPNPDNTEAADDDFLLTIVVKDTWTGKGDKTQQEGQCGYWGITIKEGPPITNPVHNVTSDVTINIIGSELEYHYVENSDDADVTYFKFDINGGTGEGQGDENLVPFRFNNAEYHYNDNEPPKNVDSVNTINPIEYTYRYNDTGYVEFCVNGGGTDEYTSIKINNVEYSQYAPHTQTDYWEHYDGYAQMFCIPNVPYSESYHVEVHGEQTSDDNKIPGFGWSYLSADRSEGLSPGEEGNFAHGYLEFVSASITIDNEDLVFNSVSAFNNYRYHNSEHGSILHFASGNKEYPEENRRLAWGEAHMPFGTTLRVRIVPDEGYQLTGLTVSENGFQATETPGEYELTLNRTNLSYNDDLNQFDLNPTFERIDAQVVASATNVAQGEITISGGQNSFITGTPKLEVTDVASMSPQRLDGFNGAAENEGYTIDNYLEISLYNTIYKGGKKDGNNNYLSWDTEVNTLENNAKATVVLQLEDNVAESINEKEVIIVHEEHDGENIAGYDLIEANYDSQNKTISFETGSFSTFAIAVRGEGNQEQDPENPPETVTVEFNSNGGSEVPPVVIDKGTTVNRPEGVTNGNLTLEGWYTDEGLHDRFDFSTPIDNDIVLYAKWVESLETYEVPDESGNKIVFEREEGHEYSLEIVDFLSYSKEEVMALGEIDSDTYDAIFGGLKNSVKDAGELLAFYNIELEEDGHGVEGGPFTIKILMTDEMKKYNSFKLFYVNDDFVVEGSPITLSKEGNYLVGTLEHLSLYALAGDITTVPKTGDNIVTYISLGIISILGLSISILFLKKKQLFN